MRTPGRSPAISGRYPPRPGVTPAKCAAGKEDFQARCALEPRTRARAVKTSSSLQQLETAGAAGDIRDVFVKTI